MTLVKSLHNLSFLSLVYVFSSVGDSVPQDPHVFKPPLSGSISQRYGSGIRIRTKLSTLVFSKYFCIFLSEIWASKTISFSSLG
jgi:hypothetical protein